MFINLRDPVNNLKKESFRNRDNLQYKKAADSVLLSLFMITDGIATILMPP